MRPRIAALLLSAACLAACTHAVGHDVPDGPVPVDAGAPADAPPPARDAGPWAISDDICLNYAPPTCVGAACATSELAAHYLELWWQSKFEAMDATPAEIASIVQVYEAAVESPEVPYGPRYVRFRVGYVARVDWVSAGGGEAFVLGEYPLEPLPDDATVLNILRGLSPPPDAYGSYPPPCRHLPRAILSFAEIGERVRGCWPMGVATYCLVRFHLQSRDPAACTIEAVFSNDVAIAKGECYGALINLESGDIIVSNGVVGCGAGEGWCRAY